MSRHLLSACAFALALFTAQAPAQEFGALARIDAEDSGIARGGDLTLEFALSQGVPWRAYTLTEPDRLILDFQEVDWTGLVAEAFASKHLASVRFGALQPGWSRFVAELAAPLAVRTAALEVDDTTAAATLRVTLDRTDRADFDAAVGAVPSARWVLPEPALRAETTGVPDVLTVVLDPGHGGIDPGALRGGYRESDLVLQLARDVKEALLRAGGINVVMTREEDHFVSLEARVAIARRAGAHLFISLHADALEEGVAHGASVYMLSDTATDEATAALAERHDRSDLLAGVDLTGSDDEVAEILMDLARQDNGPRSHMLAKAMVRAIDDSVGEIHKRPLREAGFSVLKAADIPSVLVEVGFLSTDRDLENLQDPEWRAKMARGIRDGILAWSLADATIAPLRRK
ncbi:MULTISPECIES: N-acetylmuramoyl-L-alanine amidase [Marinovum]|uniref:N-acetylmuramoyl-L-alanine amidase n=1 Tax=Marinovum TaxID=367771 RepID=UPI00237A603F|nr:N-acetylmuramoyl-L-alanine amidase [Marinovum sp. PR37]MDD9745180.1 N-acetylmuramoyl-L-alanine amidase [Marinovum sp. PR37]